MEQLITAVVVLLYLFGVGYLGYRGFRRTRTASDYLVAGRQIHPAIMALSYGATFISTSAIVGFGGVAGLFGMSLLWLTFLNILVGIFIAFVFLGGPTRRMGHHLDAHTFPELLGRRYDSKFIQVFAGLVIFLLMPLYAAAVLIGGCDFIAGQFEAIDYNTALMVFSIIIAAYVVMGGLKGVMYTDALQGSVMFVGMLLLLGYTYAKLGGVTQAHENLVQMKDLVPGKLQAIGHPGWAGMPEFGWGDIKYNAWWLIVSTITLGVGIGVLAQPQLAVRFMTVKSKKELNRAVLVGGIFILTMTGVAFTVGSLTNVYFSKHGPIMNGVVAKQIDADKGYISLHMAKKNDEGKWELAYQPGRDGNPAPVTFPAVLDEEEPYLEAAVDGKPIAQARTTAPVYSKGNAGWVIPSYVKMALPSWFGLIFLLTALAAAMSTLSSQFHAVGTSIGRDVCEVAAGSRGTSVLATRVGIVVGILIAVIISYVAHGEMIIARATAIFFGLCGAAFLPAYVGALFSRRVTKPAAIASILVGFCVSAFWLALVKAKEASAIGLVQWLTGGKTSIFAKHPNVSWVDPIVVALPLSIITIIVVSLLTKPADKAHLDWCFGGPRPDQPAGAAEQEPPGR